MWLRTVLTLMESRWAIPSLPKPSAKACRTSLSRGVSFSMAFPFSCSLGFANGISQSCA
jgi:hypothetical protein